MVFDGRVLAGIALGVVSVAAAKSLVAGDVCIFGPCMVVIGVIIMALKNEES